MWRKRLGWLLCRSAGDWPLLLLFAMTLVSLLVSPLPGQSLRAALPLVLGLVAYALMARWPTTAARLHWSWWGLILVGMLLSLLGPPGMLPPKHALFRWIPLLKQLGGYLPDTFNQNVIAGTLVVLLPFAVARALLGWPPIRVEGGPPTGIGGGHRGSRWSWVAWGTSLLASLAMMLVLTLTSSRGAYLATAASLLLLVGLSWPKARPALALVVVVAAVAVVAWLGWQRVGHALLTNGAILTLDQRLEIWSRALSIIQDFPFTGIGIGCFQAVVARIYPLFLISKGTVSHAHNLYLQVAVDLGLPGLAAYLAILGIAAHQAIGAYRRLIFQEERHLGLLAAACLSSLLGMCVHGFLDSAVWGNKGAFIPWVMLGLCAAIWGVSREGVGPSSG